MAMLARTAFHTGPSLRTTASPVRRSAAWRARGMGLSSSRASPKRALSPSSIRSVSTTAGRLKAMKSRAKARRLPARESSATSRSKMASCTLQGSLWPKAQAAAARAPAELPARPRMGTPASSKTASTPRWAYPDAASPKAKATPRTA